LSQFKKYHPSGNLKFDNLRILRGFEFRISKKKILPISPKLPQILWAVMGYLALKKKKYIVQHPTYPKRFSIVTTTEMVSDATKIFP